MESSYYLGDISFFFLLFFFVYFAGEIFPLFFIYTRFISFLSFQLYIEKAWKRKYEIFHSVASVDKFPLIKIEPSPCRKI